MITLFVIHLVGFFICLKNLLKINWIYDESLKDILSLIGLSWCGMISLIYIIYFIIKYLP
jgi:hypothetical protein